MNHIAADIDELSLAMNDAVEAANDVFSTEALQILPVQEWAQHWWQPP
jgi:hypothetical protein